MRTSGKDLFDYFHLVAAGLLVVTWVGLTIARILRERRDAALSEAPSAWRYRAQLPVDLPDPFFRFPHLFLATLGEVMEGTDEGFEVAYFDYVPSEGLRVPAAIVELPVSGPELRMREGDPIPSHVGPQTADVLKYLAGMRVVIVPFALMAWADYDDTPAPKLQREALRLAKAIVADERSAGG